jgi:hypothetical protein
MLPPYCVSIPRTDVPLETIMGVQSKKNKDQVNRKLRKLEFGRSIRLPSNLLNSF